MERCSGAAVRAGFMRMTRSSRGVAGDAATGSAIGMGSETGAIATRGSILAGVGATRRGARSEPLRLLIARESVFAILPTGIAGMVSWNGLRPMAQAISIVPRMPGRMLAKPSGVGIPNEPMKPDIVSNTVKPTAPPAPACCSENVSIEMRLAHVASATIANAQEAEREASFKPTRPSTSHTPHRRGGSTATQLAMPKV